MVLCMIQAPTHLEQQSSVQSPHSVCKFSARSQLKGQWKKGTSVFDNLKRSKVNKEILQSRKITRLNFNSTQFQLLNFNYDSLSVSCRSFSALPNADAVSSLELVTAVYSHGNSMFIIGTQDTRKNKMPVNNSSPSLFLNSSRIPRI